MAHYHEDGFNLKEIQELYQLGARPDHARKMEHGLYRKSSGEYGPTFEDKLKMVHWLLYKSEIDPSTKTLLREQEEILRDWESRGVKYALGFGLMTFFFPVVR